MGHQPQSLRSHKNELPFGIIGDSELENVALLVFNEKRINHFHVESLRQGEKLVVEYESPLPVGASQHSHETGYLVHHLHQLLLAEVPLLFETLCYFFLNRVLLVLYQDVVHSRLRAHIGGAAEALLHLQESMVLELAQLSAEVFGVIHHPF